MLSSVIDDVVVGMLVLGAITYVATTLGPRQWRGRVLAAVGRLLARTPSTLGLRGLARRLNDKAAAKSGRACGGCDNCGTANDKTGMSDRSIAPGSSEVRIPLSKIGKRT